MPSDTARTSPAHAALALLALPAVDDLKSRQVRGASCIWCDLPLTAETAIDLGERDDPQLRFPQACSPCTRRAALAAIHEHAPACDNCVRHAPDCATGTALIRLTKVGRR
jgi:hypothetical protein